MTVKRREQRRPNMRRAVILFPSGLTLGNLFFGVFAIITASRGDFVRAGVYVVLGAICDALDGRVARATNAGSEFGEELDSLVDAISFGFAPAMIMYFAVLNRQGWDWMFVFLFVAAAVLRLARFNVEQAGTAKTYFQGLPSPAAGMTLASYYWFSQSWLYDYAAVGNLPWTELLRFLMAVLAFLMISPIPYPVFPRTGFKSLRTLAGTVLLVGSFTLFVTKKLEFFFPMSLAYVAWGPIRWFFSNLFERRQPTIAYDLSEGEEEDEEEEIIVAPPVSRNRELRASREERTKLKRTQGDRDIAAPLETEPRDRSPRGEKPERVARPDRPERTEAERAARREKREKRDKREGRSPRAPRAERPAEGAVASGVDAIGTSETSADAEQAEELIGLIPGGAEEASAPGEGAPARKRKRRRRRGERKGRGGPENGGAPDGDAGAGEEGGGDDGAEDGGGDDGGDADDAGASPYASVPPTHAAPAAPAAPPYAVTPPPIPAPSAPAPPMPSNPAESSE